MFRHRNRGLSLLARGQGMVDGSVEVDCFADNPKAFSLSGKPLIRPALVAKVAKPYRPHKLTLPKTFVTRRGQMVLFTAPEDMIVGTSCRVHEREALNQTAVSELQTTGRLLDSALDYYPQDNFRSKHSGLREGPLEQEEVLTKPGHFTQVYLNSLQKATERELTECHVEDIEVVDENREVEQLVACGSELPVSECDSGLGHSVISGRLSAHSRLSGDHPLVIPHGEGGETEQSDVQSDPLLATDSGDLIAALKNELSNTKVKSSRGVKSGHKRQRTAKQSSTSSPAPQKPKAKKSNTDQKSLKSKRKRAPKKDLNTETHEEATVVDKSPEDHEQVTAVNLEPCEAVEQASIINSSSLEEPLGVEGHGRQVRSSDDTARARRQSRAEERRREIERKRAEKRELEAQKKRELEERQKLEEELAMRVAIPHPSPSDDEASDTVSMASVDSSRSPSPPPDPVSKQARLRAELDTSKLRQHRWLLLNQAEKVESELDTGIDEAEEALRLARAAEQERRRLEELARQERVEEEKRRQAELEAAARRKAMEVLATKRGQPSTKQAPDGDLSKQRQDRMFSKPTSLMFSYYNYLPPPKTKKGKQARAKGAKNKTVKAQ